MYRVEDKYVCDERDFFFLESRLKTVLKTDVNQGDDTGYTITSVYFDDYQDKHLADTEQGERFRTKYRIRIYNSSFDVIKLEVKYKRDNRVFKKSRNITYEQMKDLMEGRYVEDASPSMDNTITLFNLAISERGLTPKVIVEYERKAFVFDAGNVRITLDRRLRYSRDFDLFMWKQKYSTQMVGYPNQVLEIKYDEILPGFIAGILETGNMQQSTFSKYRLCREGVKQCQ